MSVKVNPAVVGLIDSIGTTVLKVKLLEFA